MADILPGLFLFFAKLLHIRYAGAEVLDEFRLFIIPGDKFIGIAGLVGNIPEQKPGFLTNGIIQSVKVFFPSLPAFRGADSFGKGAKRFAFCFFKFFLKREEEGAEKYDRI